MALVFELQQKIQDGSEGLALQFPDQLVETWANDGSGWLQGQTTQITEGNFIDPSFEGVGICAGQDNIEYASLKILSTEGIYGSWLFEDEQQLVIYLLQYDVSNHVVSGNIRFDITNPINRATITFDVIPEFFIDEQRSIINPGARMTLRYRSGDSAWYNMGTFYVDRANYTDLRKQAKLECRGKIGKPLKDQSFDESNSYSLDTITNVLSEIMELAGFTEEEIDIESTTEQIAIGFDRKKKIIDGINEILEAQGWILREKPDGVVVLGQSSYSGFDTPGDYEFEYGKDLYSRRTTEDDGEAYTRVCVHIDDFSKYKYEEVEIYESWAVGAQKTLYIQVADGTSQADIDIMAAAAALKYSNVGTIESFSGPFRPWLIQGDTAKITKDGTQRLVGTITNITHKYGKTGFETSFDVDSGGIQGPGKMSQYIQNLQKNDAGNSTRSYT